MKPFGRIKNVKGFKGKLNSHSDNWWETIITPAPRTTIKNMWMAEIIDELIQFNEIDVSGMKYK